jgi:hypothetical protein
MNDRELLELAAKAAGIEVLVSFDRARRRWWCWNPLYDDGDALRLAVQLGLLGAPFMTLAWIEALGDSDSYAATRRAIVRAAAEIGRGME